MVNVLLIFKKVSLLDLLIVIELIGGISFFWMNKEIGKEKVIGKFLGEFKLNSK